MTRQTRIALLAVAALAALSAAGCRRGGYVWVQQDHYLPQLSPDVQVYQGAMVLLPEVQNTAANADTWYYYSPDGRSVQYEGAPSLAAYLHACLQRAFQAAGMVVLDPAVTGLTPGLPALQINVVSWNDQELTFFALLSRDGALLYQNQYTVLWEPPASLDAAQLEQRAYRITDAAVTGLLGDAGLRTALLGR